MGNSTQSLSSTTVRRVRAAAIELEYDGKYDSFEKMLLRVMDNYDKLRGY